MNTITVTTLVLVLVIGATATWRIADPDLPHRNIVEFVDRRLANVAPENDRVYRIFEVTNIINRPAGPRGEVTMDLQVVRGETYCSMDNVKNLDECSFANYGLTDDCSATVLLRRMDDDRDAKLVKYDCKVSHV